MRLSHLLISTLIWLLPATAYAGGFEFPSNGSVALGRGGAFTARADDLICLEYNPAGLIKLPGNHVYLGNNIVQYNMSYTGMLPDGTSVDKVSNQGGPMYAAPFVAASSDFGLRDWRFAISASGPSANGIFEMEEDGPSEDPRRPHHYLMQDMNVLMAFYTVTAAYGRNDKWGIGLDLHWVDLIAADMSLWVDAYDPELPKGPFFREDSMDVHATTHVSDRFQFAATLGAWFKPIPSLEVGLSVRGPNLNFNADGTTELAFEDPLLGEFYDGGVETGGTDGLVSFTNDGKATGAKVPTTMKFSYPMKSRLGVRYVHETGSGEEARELFDIEFDVVWEAWSVLESYEVQLKDYMEIVGDGFKPEPGARTKFEFQPITIPRHYKDTWSFRLGGEVAPVKWLAVRAGTYYETGAIPAEYTNVDFASFDRIGAAAGLSVKWRWLTASLGYSHIFQAVRDVSVDETKVYKSFALRADSPTDDRYKVGAGRFDASYDIYSLGVSAAF
jgi:long-chain fatty acid transport protein